MPPSIATSAKPMLFVRTPQLTQMRDPLTASWNQDIAAREAEDGSAGKLDMAALIDFSQMNETFANYLEVVGLPVAIIDPKGKVLASSKWQRLCMEFHRVNATTLARCIESDVSLSRQMEEGKGYAIYRCRNGLTDCAAPIRVEGQHIANLFIGQFLLKPPDLEEFERQCADFGFEHDVYLEALAEVPIIDEDMVPAIMRLLVGLANQVAQQSLAAHRLRIANESLSERNIALSVAKEAAEAANVAKSAFLANISHEMRTPLNHVTGLAALIRREPLTPKQADRMDKLEAASRNLTGIIETILELTRIEAGKLDIPEEPFSIQELLNEVVAAVREQAEAKYLQVIAEATPELHDLMGGKRHLKQALLNYVSNAIRFTEIGCILIRSRLIEEDDSYALVRFEVEDTGIGIAPEDQSRLFSIFEQVDNSSTRKYGGLGMGLAMTRKIAQIMGGDSGCDSRPGVGSTFWFEARLMKV